jgi:hypothetical protein
MSWMEDRDLLLAETQKLLSALAPAKAGMTARSIVAPVHELRAAHDPSQFEPLQFERMMPLPTVNQRQEIVNRLAAFRATQARFQREREAFSAAMLNKVQRERERERERFSES